MNRINSQYLKEVQAEDQLNSGIFPIFPGGTNNSRKIFGISAIFRSCRHRAVPHFPESAIWQYEMVCKTITTQDVTRLLAHPQNDHGFSIQAVLRCHLS